MRESTPAVVTDDAPSSWRGAFKPYLIAVAVAFAATSAVRSTLLDPDLVERPLRWLLLFGQAMIVASLATAPLMAAAVLAHDRLHWRGLKLLAAGALAGAVSLAAGQAIWIAWLLSTGYPRFVRWLADQQVGVPFAYLQHLRSELLYFAFAGAALAGTWQYMCRQDSIARQMRSAELELERETERFAEACFAVLNAQIEPHFLFNSLANVKYLYRTDRAAADAMFESLLRYLETALPDLREESSTLGRELKLVEAYLDVHKVRMGERLRYHIDVPTALRDAELPPLTLLTLVENAIKHGIGHRTGGGQVWISSRLDAQRLVVTARDDGEGFDKPFGSGAGLANVRARLKSRYGPEGRLSLGRNDPMGLVATLNLPYVPSGRGA